MLLWTLDGDDLVAITDHGTYRIIGPDSLTPSLVFPDGEGLTTISVDRAKSLAADDYQENAR